MGVPANVSRDGCGLGLAIVSRIVELLGLKLHVQSAPGEGSRFTLLLPSTEPVIDVAGHSEPQPAAPPPAHQSSREVLLVEDDPGVRHATRLCPGARPLL